MWRINTISEDAEFSTLPKDKAGWTEYVSGELNQVKWLTACEIDCNLNL